MKEEKVKNAIKAGVAITILVITIIMVITIMAQYESEGEKNIPFELSKITIVSTAEVTEVTESEEADNKNWNLNVIQNNDVYLTISKNKNYNKEEIIKNITIKNIQVLENPAVGNIGAYMPNSLDGRIFKYNDEYKIEEELKYKGASKSNSKTLEVGNQGGNILMSFCNVGLGTYDSKDDTEIKHDASLIEKMGNTDEDLKFKVSFDLVIELEKKSYKTTVTLDLPCEELIEKGTSSKEITDFEEIIFKRVN